LKKEVILFTGLFILTLLAISLMLPVFSQENYVTILVTDPSGKGLPYVELGVKVNDGWWVYTSDKDGRIQIWLSPELVGDRTVNIWDTLGNALNADVSQIAFSAGRSFKITVSNARIVEGIVLDEGGGPPPISAMMLLPSPNSVVRETISRDGRLTFTLVNNPTIIYVGSPLRKTEYVVVPGGSDYKFTVTLKRTVFLTVNSTAEEVIVNLQWNDPEPYDIGTGVRVPYLLEISYFNKDGQSHKEELGTFTLTPGSGSRQFMVQPRDQFKSSILLVTLYMGLDYSYFEERVWAKVDAYGDSWVWLLGFVEGDYYRTPLLTAAVSLEILNMQQKIHELMKQIDTQQKKIQELENEKQRLRIELSSKDQTVMSLEKEKKELQSKVTSLEDEKRTLQEQVEYLQNMIDNLNTSITGLQILLYAVIVIAATLAGTTIMIRLKYRGPRKDT